MPNALRHAPGLVWGKIRRAFLIAFRKKAVEESLSLRRGACSRCGACCKILFKCPAYDDSNGEPKCLVYNDRPGVCGLFPLDPRDLRDRDLVMPEKKCGFWFANSAAPRRADAAPVRWGPPKSSDGRRRIGTFAIIKAFFKKPQAKPDPGGAP